MKKGRKALIAAAAFAAALGIAVLAAAYFSGNYHEEARALRKKHMDRYEYSKGGDMVGSRYSEIIRRYDDTHAILSISSSSWYDEDPSVSEYLLDAEILQEIESVFRKYRMHWWAHRRISRIFIADGASHSYSFRFGETSIGFSSQHYPAYYRKRLQKIDGAIEKYKTGQDKLPGLVKLENAEEGEPDRSRQPTPGEVRLEVYGYAGGYLKCRLLNGTEEEAAIPNQFRLFRTDDGEEIPVLNSKYEMEYAVAGGSVREERAEVAGQLLPGSYRLEVGGFSARFEIR